MTSYSHSIELLMVLAPTKNSTISPALRITIIRVFYVVCAYLLQAKLLLAVPKIRNGFYFGKYRLKVNRLALYKSRPEFIHLND